MSQPDEERMVSVLETTKEIFEADTAHEFRVKRDDEGRLWFAIAFPEGCEPGYFGGPDVDELAFTGGQALLNIASLAISISSASDWAELEEAAMDIVHAVTEADQAEGGE